MRKQDFNKDWSFKKIFVGMATGAPFGGTKMSEAVPVVLPHDAMISETRSADSTAGGPCGYYPGGNYEYTKTFFVDEREKEETFILEFEGIYNRGLVYVNGALAGSAKYGYTRLFLDITQYLVWGADNQILVKVINSDVPNSRWYTGSGIYRPVNLYKGGIIRIAMDGLRIFTPEISEEVAVVEIETKVKNDKKLRKVIVVKSEIYDMRGVLVTEESSPMTLFSEAETVQTQRIYLKNPLLWAVDHPNLYQCKITLYDGDTILDTTESTFGIRKLQLDVVNGLRINGEKTLLRGGCIHHDNGPVGAATFARAEERRIELLKEAGFNSVRISHNSSSKSLLDACDRLGMLVLEESFDTWTQEKQFFDSSISFLEHWEKDLEDIVQKDFNHPCVFMYSIGNEIFNMHEAEGVQWSRRLANKVRELDSTRYVTNAINCLATLMPDVAEAMLDLDLLTENQKQSITSATQTSDINDAMTAMMGKMNELSKHPKIETGMREAYGTLDVIGMNYMRGAYEQMEAYPHRVFFGSETLPPDIDLNWELVKKIPACIGDYTWTAWDYIGEAGIGVVTYGGPLVFKKPYPVYLAYCGDFDITGYRRPISYLREIVFGLRKEPYIAVQLPEYYGIEANCTPWVEATTVSTWTWKGSEGQRCLAEVYSDAMEVELFINEKSVGKQPAGKENRYRAIFDTVYEPGQLKAVAYYADGSERSYSLQTAKDEVALCMIPDRYEMEEDDLVYIPIELRDENGVLQTARDCKVKLTIEGEGVIQGFGSADPESEENFFDNIRTTFYGRALAVVRAKKAHGTIRITAEAEGLESKTVKIQVK